LTDTAVRPLTPGELALAQSVFGDALDTAIVTLRRAKYWMWQPAWVVMAPDGHIWFHPNGGAWCEDFSGASFGLRALLVHELVHVWQRQQGVNLLLRRRPFARYRYRLTPGKPFAAYGIEQQASIVEHAWLRREAGGDLAAYAAVIPFGVWA
jgi:hypothetical protein